jgi:hypothetical protein
MKSSLRPTSPADFNAIRLLLQRAFHADQNAPFLNPSVMAWKYWDRRDDWEGPRAYVLERDGVIVAHAGIYPLTFGAGEVRGIQMIDWASAREVPGAGLALLQKLSAMFDFIYSIGGSEMTCRILPGFGFVECARQWKGARPLRPFQQIRRHQHRDWKLVPRFARNLVWSSRKPVDGLYKGWQSDEISPADISRDLYSMSAADACFSPRPPAFFEYLLRCPAMPVRIYGIHHEREPKGHFAIGVLRGQARVAGVWVRDPNPEVWQAAFSLTQQTAERLEGACEIVAAGTEGPSERGAARSAWRILGHTPVYLLNKKGKFALQPGFQFQLSDDDAFFLDTGSSSYWT